MKKKVFRSRVSKLYVFSVVFFSIVAILFITSLPFLKNLLMFFLGIIFLLVDGLFLLPNMFFTKYTFDEQYLVVREWPFHFTYVYYEDVVSFDDNDENDRVRKAGMSFSVVTIGYYDDDDVKQFIEVSPKDMDMFLLVLGSRVNSFKNAEQNRVERIAREKDEKHRRRKKYLENEEKKKQDLEESTTVIKVTGLVREKGFKVITDE